MGVGTSIFLIAVGAILDFAVKVQGDTHGVNVNRVGLIILIVGIVGLVISLIFWSSWGGFGGYRRRRTVTRHQSYPDGDPRGPGESPRSTYVDERERY